MLLVMNQLVVLLNFFCLFFIEFNVSFEESFQFHFHINFSFKFKNFRILQKRMCRFLNAKDPATGVFSWTLSVALCMYLRSGEKNHLKIF